MKENRWNVRCYITIFFILYRSIAGTVTWKRITDPIVFGDDVTLKCFLPINYNKSYLRQWKIGDHVLTYDEATTTENRNKYTGFLEDDGFSLIIKYFQPGDFRRNYTCSYQFDEYTANLTTENYQCYPEQDSYNVDVSSFLSKVEINITFQKIYPIPQCKIYIHNRELESESVNTSHEVDTYCLGLTMKLSYEYGMFECGEEASVSCSVGNRSFPLAKVNVTRTCEAVCLKMSPCLNNGPCMHDTMNVSCNCTEGYDGQRCEHFLYQTIMTSTTDPNKTGSPASTTMIVIITSVVFFIVIIIVVVSVYNRRKCSPIEKAWEFVNSTNTNEKEGRGNMNGNSSRHNGQDTPMISIEDRAV